MTSPRLILASTSPYRRQLLEKLRLPFEAIAPEVDETAADGETPPPWSQRLAAAKARSVALDQDGPALVIGSDQVATLDDTILTKPGDHARARAQLAACNGRSVEFHTGLALADTRSESPAVRVERVVCRVAFRTLSDDEIERYLRAEQPYDCAGSIRSEGYAVTLFETIEAPDPNALVGLPLIRLAAMLRAAGLALP
ncbi:MAG: Maf family nucleotide pyrophosphatase [Halofilum sp. (in: g-proteobacteria)]|nr:Maf family nucleotide pyrophosphatase [Halofilum sp. (in: g-proteobacteria)]